MVQRRRLIGEVGFYDIQKTIAVIIGRVHTHPALRAPDFVNSYPSEQPDFCECSIAIIFEQQTRGRIVCNVNVHPAIVVVVGHARRKAVSRLDLCNTRRLRYIGKGSVAIVVIKNVLRPS